MNKYYDMLNESFDKLLVEAQQIVIDFKNIFGDETLERFNRQKQRMTHPENDISYWVRRFRDEGDSVIDEIDEFISAYENKLSRREKDQRIAEGAEVIYEDDEWIVLKINTYEAAKKYGAGTTWCITGRYPGHEERGEHFFNSYRDDNGWDYYFYIKKDGRDLEGRQEKYCLCWDGSGDDYSVYNSEDDEIAEEGVHGAPTPEGFPDISIGRFHSYDDDGEPIDEPVEEDEPVEWEDENGNVHPGHRPAMPQDPVMIPVENPDSMEFSATSKEEAVRMFAEAGFEGAEIVGAIAPNLYVCHFMVEPEHQEFELEDGDIYTRDLPGDRFTAFVYMPGQGGGPLMGQRPNGFDIVAFRTEDGVRRQFGNMQAGDIHRQDEPVNNELRPEEQVEESCKLKEESQLENGFFYFCDGECEDEMCKGEDCVDSEKEIMADLPMDNIVYCIVIAGEPMLDIDGEELKFNSEEEAEQFAIEELEMLDGEYEIVPAIDIPDEILEK